MEHEQLTDREKTVLQAVIQSYIETAEPCGSRRLVQLYDLGVSPATVRNTMADLETKGFLSHPHTSAGRMPTDLAYRYYVDALMGRRGLTPRQRAEIEKELRAEADTATGIEALVQRAARVLGLLTGELGLSVGPLLAEAVLRQLELVPIDSERALLVLGLESGVVRTVYVPLPTALPRPTLESVARALNERLAGDSLAEIQVSLRDRLRDLSIDDPSAAELLSIFVESGPDLFEWAMAAEPLHLGSASVLADQPEFREGDRLKALLELTERRELLASLLRGRAEDEGPVVTIGAEHGAPELSDLTIITATFSIRDVHGVLGVIGPTRMPYDRIVSLVDGTSSLVSRLIDH